MKSRAVKLREAHKNNGPSACSLLWDNDGGKYLVTASSSAAAVAVHELSSAAARTLRHHRDGVTCLALNPNSTSLASGSIDHSVKLYQFPSGEFQSNVTRFTLPIRCLAFNSSGSLLAAAGDDDGIKLIATIDGSIARVLKGHRGTVTGLDFDPKNEFLASADSTGAVFYWDLSTGEAVHKLKSVAPDREGSNGLIQNVVFWRPDGDVLAVPGLKNDVVMLDRDTAEKVFGLKGDHEDSVCFFSWSPNGKYMATAGADRQVLIWDVDLKQDIERQRFEERISSLAWKPSGNALAVIDCMGKFGVWETPVPSFMKSPVEDVPVMKTKNQGSLFFDEDESSSEIAGHKRLRRGAKVVDDDQERYDDDADADDDDDDEDDLLRAIESRERQRSKRRTETGKSSEVLRSKELVLQAAFQPCSTPEQSGKKRFLCYNMIGTVTTMEKEGYAHIEVDFHDTGRGSRVPALTDFFGFTMASMNESGSVFANPCHGEKSASTLTYRPFSSWANNSEWSMRFEAEEEVKVVALGSGWVAAVTNLNFLRIFSEGGLQKHIISLDGPVVTAVGFRDELAVVTHVSVPLPSGDQTLEVRVFNMASRTLSVRCPVPLSPGSNLSWFGFSEEGQLSSWDSHGVLRVFNDQFSGSWIPLFRAKQSDEEIYWVVGLNATKLFCIVCKPPETFPVVSPKPVLTLLDLVVPVVVSDLSTASLENEFIMCGYRLSLIQSQMELAAAAGKDTAALDDEAFNVEAAFDRCILRLIASCCNGDKLVRATELAKSLLMKKSIAGAIKLVNALKLPNLAERFSSILEERMLGEGSTSSTEALRSRTLSTEKGEALAAVGIPSTMGKEALLQSIKRMKNSDSDGAANGPKKGIRV